MSPSRSREELVEQQALSSEIHKRTLAEAGSATSGRVQEGPWITLSRQIGSGGAALGYILAGRLGWQVFDQELLARVAEKTRASRTTLAQLDESAVGALRGALAHMVVPDDPGQAAYLQEMGHAILDCARAGKAIIVGRGANWLLDPRFGLRIRVVAPIAQRVARIAQREAIDSAEAERRIRQNDEKRRGFIRQVFGKDIDDPFGYDLVLNSGALDLPVAAEMIVGALAAKCPK